MLPAPPVTPPEPNRLLPPSPPSGPPAGRAHVRVAPPGEPAARQGLLARIVAWFRRLNRGRLAARRARRLKAAAARSAAAVRTLPDALAAVTSSDVFAHGTWAQTPAAAEVAWGAYEWLSGEIARRRRARIDACVPRPPPLLRAPEHLAAFASTIELPAPSPAPRASIVVPAYNHLRETLECIASIAAFTAGEDYEVVVVDDASRDETAAVLPLVRNLRHVRNETNRGFVASCNRGAGESRGEVLVFLNNDAQVTRGWLAPLLRTFSDVDRVGAVGPKLLFPDGRLQEAGTMVNPDLSVTMVGLFDDPDRARYGYAREVHYVSGACLAVARRAFEEAGGFSRDLEPAYYEDCDLQLSLRGRGLRTIYQPASVVVHHLSLTSQGLADPAGFKKRQIVRNSQRMREKWGDVVDAMDAVRLVAFYLPQFHPILENDAWWGKGFTEWANVAKARPNFVGHEQPRVPGELGFYDLRVPDVMAEQARLARAYGIHGFCFYYYWFHGKRLLEMPIERLLEDRAASFPFCLCWANENWTRTWDGGSGESEILIGQQHSDADDEAVIRDLLRYLGHPAYIRVRGRPMLLVYRVELFPDIRRTAELWREVCRREGVGELHLVRVDSFDNASATVHPTVHGLDAAVEFPPHHRGAPLADRLAVLNAGFNGAVHDYEELVLQSHAYKDAGYPHYRCVMPRWDNTARRQDGSHVWARATPGAYQAWLEEALRYTREQHVGDERLVFLNAWNEWAEGAHLEPERKYERDFLEATRNALGAHLRRRDG
jgi:GT2 family glycosyltransferase